MQLFNWSFLFVSAMCVSCVFFFLFPLLNVCSVALDLTLFIPVEIVIDVTFVNRHLEEVFSCVKSWFLSFFFFGLVSFPQLHYVT